MDFDNLVSFFSENALILSANALISDLPLWGLFLSAFISSTIAPGGSEILVASLANQATYSSAMIVSIATLGNTLGAITTYGLGRWLGIKYTSEKLHKYNRAIERVKKYGSASLLVSWLPIIGDGLCFAAGWLKIPLLYATLLILLGKAARYSAIVYWFN
ncbi:MAG: hypothetical protein COB51_12055 [Moraxellaceae bacterium]|nr:MAG: hypothetical protein COB51_12055 [Moraxellaceae bacterium]